MADNDSHPLLDDKLVEALESTPHEEQLIGGYETDGSGRDATADLARDWFPDKDSWAGKTEISARQAKHLAAARNLSTIFPELTDVDDFIQQFLDDYEEYLTSVDGKAREQHERVLRAGFGDQSLSDDAGQSVTIFHGDPDED